MTRRDRRRRFSQWLSDLFSVSQAATGVRRPVLVEPLERRQLLAGDTFLALLGSAAYDQQSSEADWTQNSTFLSSSALSSNTLVAEGEPANDLVAFAKALADSGTRFFGAAWCPFCTQQKQLFEDGGKFLPFIEVTNPDRSPNQIADDEGITEYPTWEFPDGSRLTGVVSLATLSDRAEVAIPQSSSPSMANLADVTVRVGSPLHIPVDAYDPNGNPLTITVTSSDPSLVAAELYSGNRSLRVQTANFGDMVFELFENKAPRPAQRVIELAEDGFYDGVNFHRVINNFVIQGGDPTGTGAGGSTLGDFDDQFHLDLQHNRTGMLSFAKSSDDTNDSQFFITEGPQRFLDFNHSVFGVLVEGEQVREAISNTATDSSDRPINPVTIASANVFDDTENGVIMLKALGASSGSATITVTVTDTEGNSTSQSFVANVAADTANGAPFLNDISEVQTQINTPVTVNLTAQDKEGDTLIYSVQKLGTENFTVTVDSATGVATVTPPTGFTGELQFRATVRQSTTPTTNSQDDNQVVTVVVSQSTATPTAIDLLSASDSGVSSTDNITNAQSLTFAVSGTTAGATVEVRSGGAVVGSATATGTTTEVTVGDVASLGQGSVSFTARQTIDGQTSSDSPSMSVVLDNQSPIVISSGVFPANVIVDSELELDLDHAEEGSGLTYGLASAPQGMTIGANDGVINWIPSSSQLGAQALTLTLTDAAGNETQQEITLNVIEEPQVQVTLVAVDDQGQPITTVATGQTFKVQVIVHDQRDGASASGVFAAYLDLLFDADIIEPVSTNPIAYITPYVNDKSGTVGAGIIDELGAFSSSTAQLGSDARVLAEVTFLAKAAGNPQLRTESADDAGNDILLYDQTAAVPSTRVEFGVSTFMVGADFEAVDDVFNFDEDSGTHSLNVLDNDTVTGSAVLTIVAVGTASGGGTVSIATDGKSLNYTSAGDFNGAETFTYTVENQAGVQLTATVTVQVADVNDPPVALNDTFTVFRNSNNNVLEVLNNDTQGADEEANETLTVTAVSSGSAGGAITIGPSGLTVRYTPPANFTGTETFTYTLSDGRGGTDTATVTVSVNQQNPPPTPQDDNFTVEEDAALASFDVLANDTTDDPEETLSISAVGSSQVGSTVSISSDGLKLNYKPAADFNGTEVITYTLRDSGGATAVGRVTFTVTPVNDPPTAVDDQLTALSSQPTTTLNVLANDTNVDAGEVLTITAVTQPPTGSGTLAITNDGKSLIYTPPSSSFEGSFSATYTIDDGTGLTDTATVTVDVQDFIPRKISGQLRFGDDAAQAKLGGVQLSLTGTDITGATVSKQTTVAADGSYAFASLAPGDYTLTRQALPFLNDSGASVVINSGMDDGDEVTDLFVTGALKADFIDLRDFLGSASRNSLTVALHADGTENWIAARGDWAALSSIDVGLNTSNQLVINAKNQSQQNLSATVPLNGSSRVSQVGQEGSMRLLRIRGSTTQIGLQQSTGTASTASASSLVGEGEAPASGMPVLGSGTPQVTGTGGSAPTGNAIDSDVDVLTPAAVLRQLLGSAQHSPVGGTPAVMSSAAIDRAMEAVMPAMQLELSESLQEALAADHGEEIPPN